MKDIGLKLKNKREENGVSVEEAAEDLKMRPSQIISLEEGKKEDFKDIGVLKYFIRDYAKYLGLDSDKILDEFNEFLFDFTTKIPVEEIEKAKAVEIPQKAVVSPYTKIKDTKNIYKLIMILVVIIVFSGVVGYLMISKLTKDDFKGNNVTYEIRRTNEYGK